MVSQVINRSLLGGGEGKETIQGGAGWSRDDLGSLSGLWYCFGTSTVGPAGSLT